MTDKIVNEIIGEVDHTILVIGWTFLTGFVGYWFLRLLVYTKLIFPFILIVVASLIGWMINTSPKATFMIFADLSVAVACAYVASRFRSGDPMEQGMIGFIVGLLVGGALAGPMADYLF